MNGRHDETIDAILDAAKSALDAAGPAISMIPGHFGGLNVAIGSLSKIIDMIQKTRENDSTRDELAHKLKRLADIIKNSTDEIQKRLSARDAPSGEKPGLVVVQGGPLAELLSRIDALDQTLQPLASLAEKLQLKLFLLRCLQYKRNARVLASLKSGIDEAISDFEFRGHIKIDTLISEVAVAMIQVQAGVVRIEKNQVAEEESRILEKLERADAHYQSYHNRDKEGVHPGTRQDLLREISEWVRGAKDVHPVYILSGAAGTGKSTIALEMAKRLDKEKLLGASFFFNRGEESLSCTRLVFTTIAHQLAITQPRLRQHIIRGARKHVESGHLSQMEFQAADLLEQPLKDVPGDHPPVVFILDAVDECTDRPPILISKMLNLLLQIASSVPFPLRILVTTRPEKHIQEVFLSPKFHDAVNIKRLHDIPPSIVTVDITRYLQDRIRDMLPETFVKAHRDAASCIAERANGLFIYAKTAVDFLSAHPRDADESLKILLSNEPTEEEAEFYEQLDKLYLAILRQSFQTFKNTARKARVQIVLGTIALLQEYMSPKAMAGLLQVPVDHILSVVENIESVVIRDTDDSQNGKLRPLHATFPQYLTHRQRCVDPDFYIDPAVHHGRLALACLNVLLGPQVLQRNPCQLEYPTRFKKGAAKSALRLDVHVPEHVEYACLHWAAHLQEADSRAEIQAAIDAFCSDKVLLWLEVLSYLDRLDIAVRTLLIARVWYEKHSPENIETTEILHDALRFVLEFFDIINICPEQIYVSALPQIPTCTLAKRHATRAEGEMKLITARDSHWGPCLRVIETQRGRLIGVKFHPNGQYIASCALHGQVDLWDATSGVHLMATSDYPGADSFDVSWEDRHVVSCWRGGNDVYFFNGEAGGQTQYLNSAENRLNSVAFTHDGLKFLTPVLDDFRVLVWDAQKLEVSSTIICERMISTPITFSMDGQRATSGSSRDVCIWDADKGTLLKLLVGHTDDVLSTVFFPDGNHVASGARDGTIRIWDVETEECLHVLPHSGPVNQVVVSPRGDLIASGSDMVRLWDARNPKCLATFQGHSSSVTSVSFSPTGDHLISGSWDGTVRIWDITDLTSEAATPPGHNATVTCLAFSNENDMVASGSADRRIIVWDTSSGKRLKTFEGHDSTIVDVAFSPDGKRLISTASHDRSRVWDIESGKMVMTINHRDAYLASYSPDGKWIVTGRRSLQSNPSSAASQADHSDLRLFRASDGLFEKDFNVATNVRNLILERLEFSSDSTLVYAVCTSSAVYAFDIRTGQAEPASNMKRSKPTQGEFMASPWDGWISLLGADHRTYPVCWLESSRRPAPVVYMGRLGMYMSKGHHLAIGSGTGRITLLDIFGAVSTISLAS
ncbi:WD40 repeat-like protein [Obba rivulosa]|uniref:WD40 repeat-like protein n=1 Tax=Obba rivulosa TaxID=1052685 RepID=A0A8E2DNT8_9APHY|nr:WD40 repeat-like protein [Obba rivulosa]